MMIRSSAIFVLKEDTRRTVMMMMWRQPFRRLSSSSSSSSKTAEAPKVATKLHSNATAAEHRAYMHQANAEMEKYHSAKMLYRQGKLSSKTGDNNNQTIRIQLTVAGLFLVCFAATPILGQKIATDPDFRQRWIPAWYDFTVKKPERPWTRQELHEQMVSVQTELRERAIRGDFSPEKMQEMKRNLAQQEQSVEITPVKPEVPEGWTRIHPGVAENESVNED